MARKKSRRKRKPNVPGQTRDRARAASQPKTANLAEEYGYVWADLGRIGVIAAILLGGLVALSFILR